MSRILYHINYRYLYAPVSIPLLLTKIFTGGVCLNQGQTEKENASTDQENIQGTHARA